jgi:hypothetical protein
MPSAFLNLTGGAIPLFIHLLKSELMQPLRILNNVQKARLLHNLLNEEIPAFLAYLNELTETVLNNREQIAADWKDQFFGVEFWFGLAEDVQRIMAKYTRDLYKSPNVFADQLFDGYTAIFCAHALMQYVAQAKHGDPKFKRAVELLFQ